MITRFKIIGCLAASALVFLLATPHALGAQDETAKPGSLVVVNLELKDVPVKDAIAKLFEGAGLKYSMKPEVPGRVVELTLKGITFPQALDALAEAARFTYKVQDETYILTPMPTASTGNVSGGETAASVPGSSTASSQSPGGASDAAATQAAQTQSPTSDGQNATQTGVATGEQQTPVFYGELPPPDYYFAYELEVYRPVYEYGNLRFLGGHPPIVLAGGHPTVIRRVGGGLPPPGYVGPDVLRFLRGQSAIGSRIIIAPH